MKRWVLLGLAAAIGVTVAGPVWAQYRKDEEKIRLYVMAEKRGFDVLCNTYGSLEMVKQREAELQQEAAMGTQANAQILKEIAELKRKLPQQQAALGREKDEAKKAELKAAVEQAEQSIKDKQAALKPVVQWIKAPRAYSKPEDATAWINMVQAQARAEKDRYDKQMEAKQKAEEAKLKAEAERKAKAEAVEANKAQGDAATDTPKPEENKPADNPQD